MQLTTVSVDVSPVDGKLGVVFVPDDEDRFVSWMSVKSWRTVAGDGDTLSHYSRYLVLHN